MAIPDYVSNFMALRETLTPPGTPMPKPDIAVPRPAAPAAAPAPTATKGPSGRLVSWGGYQFDESVLPRMQELAGRFGLRVSSGYRDPDRNRRAGGVPNSNHLTGRAGDFVGSAKAMHEAAAWARANGAREVLVHNAGSGMHLHVSW